MRLRACRPILSTGEKSDISLFSKLLYEKIRSSVDWILKCQNLKLLILAGSDAPVVRNDLNLRLAPQTPNKQSRQTSNGLSTVLMRLLVWGFVNFGYFFG